MGALLACALDHARGFAVLGRLLGERISAPAALGVLAVLVVDGRAPLVLVHLAMTLLVGACSARPDHGLRAMLDAPPVKWIGTISYPLYLVHVAVFGAVKHGIPAVAADAPLVFAIGLVAALPVAYALHRALDVPLQSLRRRLR
jgi:peptidoglycan/LPS O-acetylase OafA/YrhL